MQRFIYPSLILLLLAGCSSPERETPNGSLYIFRWDPSTVIQLTQDLRIQHELPISIPNGCVVDNLYTPPQGGTFAIELSCSFGKAVVWLDSDTGEITQPVNDSDSHFMAWAADGRSIYLKVNTISKPHIIRAHVGGQQESVPISEFTYDISPRPGSQSDFLFSFSRGMGLGSEMWLARFDGRLVKQVMADPNSYLSFAQWSPDGSRVTFIKIPDSATPFTIGELWLMQADGSGARKLADADAGHGFSPAWSPDGSQIAYVVRQSPVGTDADQNADALRSNISVVNVNDGTQVTLTHFENARVEAPAWSPDGNRIAFSVVLNDKMTVYVADMLSGNLEQVLTDPACCPAWLRK